MPSSYGRLTIRQWKIMEKILPVKQKGRYRLRDIVDAVLWQLRTGGQWRTLPGYFPKWGSVHYFFPQVDKGRYAQCTECHPEPNRAAATGHGHHPEPVIH